MSEADLDLVRSVLPAPDVDVVPLFRDDAMSEAMREVLKSVFAADFDCAIVFPGSRTDYTGMDGLRQAWLDWLEPYERYCTEVEELVDLDGRVLALVRDRGFRGDVDGPIEMHGAAIWTVTDGLVRNIVFYAHREAALADAGLDAEPKRAAGEA